MMSLWSPSGQAFGLIGLLEDRLLFPATVYTTDSRLLLDEKWLGVKFSLSIPA
jgi:hypothetical protein